jgi:hypothetical protein
LSTIEKRIEKLEEMIIRRNIEREDRFFACRSDADLEFYVLHGHFPEGSVPVPPIVLPKRSWKERIRGYRFRASRSPEELEFFVLNRYWPKFAKADHGGKEGTNGQKSKG